MTQFGPAREDEGAEQERGWNVLRAETFLIVHSHRLYVTTGSRDAALQQPWEAKALSPAQWLPRSNLIIQGPPLTQQNSQTDIQYEARRRQQTNKSIRKDSTHMLTFSIATFKAVTGKILTFIFILNN